MLYNIKALYLHCVFHGIRFKVNEDWVSVIDTLLFLYVAFTFSFDLMQKKKITKRKNQGCTFWTTSASVSAKQKELASLKQLFVLNASTLTSTSRPKSEANHSSRNIASLVFYCVC